MRRLGIFKGEPQDPPAPALSSLMPLWTKVSAWNSALGLGCDYCMAPVFFGMLQEVTMTVT